VSCWIVREKDPSGLPGFFIITVNLSKIQKLKVVSNFSGKLQQTVAGFQ
jgi:hypothetical protein